MPTKDWDKKLRRMNPATLFKALKSAKTQRERWRVVDAIISKKASEKTNPVLMRCLASDKLELDRPTRLRIFNAIGDIGAPESIPFLIDVIEKSEEGTSDKEQIADICAAMGCLLKLKAKEAIPLLIERLSHPRDRIRSEAMTTLVGFDWQPESLKEKILSLANKKEWESITALGPQAAQPLMDISADFNFDSGEYFDRKFRENMMLCLASTGHEEALPQVLSWLCRPGLVIHDESTLLASSERLRPMFGELSPTLLKAAGFVDCQIRCDSARLGRYSYTYRLDTAKQATKDLRASSDPMAKRALNQLRDKKPIQLVGSEDEEWGGHKTTVDFSAQFHD